MNFTFLNETYGEPAVLAAGGLLVGLLFGFLRNVLNFAYAPQSSSFGIINSAKNSQFGY